MTDHQCRRLLEAITQDCYVLELCEDGPTIQCVSQALMDEACELLGIPGPKPMKFSDVYNGIAL